ncbi:HORMA domain-containing protein [Emericellopsis atlantica]|uniref:HORMA domain-containing protein n=1 Tax=Emericellopsis atlantica TaxID=2614577 RepID=A0A9P8CP91_9HYPO|nr:HORMA domain-containing protein [Emericellopsis atlantica]KAG9254293.1 HORMA domain-containing protein [Emericellopsis atlantica]
MDPPPPKRMTFQEPDEPGQESLSDPPSAPEENILSTYAASTILSSFTSFLTLTIHTLLHHRDLYPSTTFITVRALNLPVYQSRHPAVCAWVNAAVSSLLPHLRAGTLAKVVFSIHAGETLDVQEKWVIDVSHLPHDWGEEFDPAAAAAAAAAADEEVVEEEDVPMVDINESYRGALQRIAFKAEKLPPPPKGSTFTLALELRDDAAAPIGQPQPWIPVQKHKGKVPAQAQRTVTTPIRAVHAGPIFFECWVEQVDTSKHTSS